MIATLLKVLCECVMCAIFQCDNLSAVLIAEGSLQNVSDSYVLNKEINGVECTMCIYVGDLIDVIEEVKKHLSDRFSDTHVSPRSNTSESSRDSRLKSVKSRRLCSGYARRVQA
jgi:hypothetical protein